MTFYTSTKKTTFISTGDRSVRVLVDLVDLIFPGILTITSPLDLSGILDLAQTPSDVVQLHISHVLLRYEHPKFVQIRLHAMMDGVLCLQEAFGHRRDCVVPLDHLRGSVEDVAAASNIESGIDCNSIINTALTYGKSTSSYLPIKGLLGTRDPEATGVEGPLIRNRNEEA